MARHICAMSISARAKGIVPRLAAVGAPHGLQRAIERDELVALGRIAVEQALVNAGVARRIEQMDHGGLAIATGAAAHLLNSMPPNGM